MGSKPGVDKPVSENAEQVGDEWQHVLAHRSSQDGSQQEAVARFEANGITAGQVQAALADGGDALYAAATSGVAGWEDEFGGDVAVALLAAEVSALAAHLNSRASSVRSVAVSRLLDDFSAVTVAAQLGVSRQKVYDIARGELRPEYLDQVPWRRS